MWVTHHKELPRSADFSQPILPRHSRAGPYARKMALALLDNGAPPADLALSDIDLSSIKFWGRRDGIRDGAFATLRREAPISFHGELAQEGFEPGPGHWALTRYDDVFFASRHPHIFSSAAGIKAVPGCGHYCATKFGVVGLTNSLAVELGPYGIRVNSVHPYGTDTPMGNDTAMYQMFADHQTYIHSFSPGALPTDSLAAPDLVSDIVLWLAGDESSLVTAAQIPADKGYLKI